MAGELQRLVVRIGADLTELNTKLNDASSRIDKAAQKMSTAGRRLSVGVTLPLVAVGAGLLAATKKAAEFADQIDKTAIRTGLSRGTLQELKFVTDQLGVSFEAVQGSVAAFTRNIPQIEKGAGDSAKAFAQLGVQLRGSDGQIRSMSALYPEMIRALASMTNEVERNALATKLFGRGAVEIVPMLAAGADKIDELTRKAHELGLVMGDDAVAGLVDFKDQMAAVQASAAAAGRGIAIAVLPILRDHLLPLVQDKIVPAIRAFSHWLGELNPRTVRVGFAVAALAAALGPLLIVLSKVVAATVALTAAMNPWVALAVVVGTAMAGLVAWYTRAAEGADSAAASARRFSDALSGQSKAAVIAATTAELARQDEILRQMDERGRDPRNDLTGLSRQLESSQFRVDKLIQKFNELNRTIASTGDTGGGGGGGADGMVNRGWGPIPSMATLQRMMNALDDAREKMKALQFQSGLPQTEDAAKKLVEALIQVRREVAALEAGFGALGESGARAMLNIRPQVSTPSADARTAQMDANIRAVLDVTTEKLKAVSSTADGVIRTDAAKALEAMRVTDGLRELAIATSQTGFALGNLISRIADYAASLRSGELSTGGIIGGALMIVSTGLEMMTRRQERSNTHLRAIERSVERVANSLSNVPLTYNYALSRHRVAGMGGSDGATSIGVVNFNIDSQSTWNGIKTQMRTAAAGGDPLARRLVTVAG
jgi:uncharacterized protein YukE